MTPYTIALTPAPLAPALVRQVAVAAVRTSVAEDDELDQTLDEKQTLEDLACREHARDGPKTAEVQELLDQRTGDDRIVDEIDAAHERVDGRMNRLCGGDLAHGRKKAAVEEGSQKKSMDRPMLWTQMVVLLGPMPALRSRGLQLPVPAYLVLLGFATSAIRRCATLGSLSLLTFGLRRVL